MAHVQKSKVRMSSSRRYLVCIYVLVLTICWDFLLPQVTRKMEAGDPGGSMPQAPLRSEEALLRVIREVAQTIVQDDMEAGIQHILDLHQRVGLETGSKRPSLAVDAAEAYTAEAGSVQPQVEDENPPPAAEGAIAMLEEGGVSDDDQTYIMPLAGEEQAYTGDSVRHSFTSIQALADVLVNSAVDSGLSIVLAKEVGRNETLAMQRLPEDSPSVDPSKVQHGEIATAAGYLDSLITNQDVPSVAASEIGKVDIHTLAMQLVESTFSAAMATVPRRMTEEEEGQTEAATHMDGVNDIERVSGQAANRVDNPRRSISRPGVGADLKTKTRHSKVEENEGRGEATSIAQAAGGRETGQVPTYDELPPQQEDTRAAEGQGYRPGKRPSGVARAAEPEMGEEGPTDPAAAGEEKAQAEGGPGGQRRSRASSTAGQVVEAKGGKKGKAKKGLRHETLRVRRIRQQRKRPRPPRLTTPYVPPPVPIALRHPGHESGRVLRLRTMWKRFKKIRRRKRRAAQAHAPQRQLQQAGYKVSANSSMSDESLGGAWPLQTSLLARYMAHALALARSPGLEPLLHDSVLTYAGALGPRYDPLLPLALVDGLVAQEAKGREIALPRPYQEEPDVPETGGGEERGEEEEPGRGQEEDMAMAEERASQEDDVDMGQEEGGVEREDREMEMEQGQEEEVVVNDVEPQVEAPRSSIEVNQELADLQRRRRRKRSLPRAQVLLEGPAASALDAYLSLAVGTAPTDPRLPCAIFPLLKETVRATHPAPFPSKSILHATPSPRSTQPSLPPLCPSSSRAACSCRWTRWRCCSRSAPRPTATAPAAAPPCPSPPPTCPASSTTRTPPACIPSWWPTSPPASAVGGLSSRRPFSWPWGRTPHSSLH